MERRTFLTGVAGAVAAAAHVSADGLGQDAPRTGGAPEFYVWQEYILRNGTQPRRLADFLQNAAIPALNRLDHRPVGVFEVVSGLATPAVFVLVPFRALDAFGSLQANLVRDGEFLRAGAAYIDAPAEDPVYLRQHASLLAAFAKMPRIEVPPATAKKGPRLFELRTYESPSEKAHRAKVEMFSEMGELDIFRRVGLRPVFFAHTLVGQRMPSLVYMLVHDNMAAREKSWDAFRNDPEWKKLSSAAGYSNADIVSNITTVYLQPAAYSQI